MEYHQIDARMQLGKKLVLFYLIVATIATMLCSVVILNRPTTNSDTTKQKFSGYTFQSKERMEGAFYDLTMEFEEKGKNFTEFFNVLQFLKRDGHTLTPVSVNLKKIVQQNISGEDGEMDSSPTVFQIPNVVHYVHIGTDLTFNFLNYLSYRSVERFIKPLQIFVHGDHIPSGIWWNRTINEVKNIYHVNAVFSKNAPNGQTYSYRAHISDYARTEVLLRCGGIYLDPDVIVVKSFTPLRKYSAVIGREVHNGLCNGIMLAKRGAPFLRLLLEQYHSYSGENETWNKQSVINPHTLAELYPHLIHVEETTLDRPNWEEADLIYDKLYNWTQNYAVHLWVRLWPEDKKPLGFEHVLTKNTTLGEIARLAIFGSHQLRSSDR